MGYEGNERRYGYGADRGRSYGYDQGRDPRRDEERGYGDRARRDYRGDFYNEGRGYGRGQQGYDYKDRGFVDRAGDEVRSWFGDEDAERRRRQDERHDQRYEDRSHGWSAYRGRDHDRGYERDRGYYGQSQGARYREDNPGRPDHDPNYSSWRDRQMAAFDNDYEEYRREHQGKFDSEFGSWRQNRQGQRELLGRVQEHQEVVGSDGQHVGKVDHVQGDRIKLAKSDQDAGGHHHSIPSSWIQSVDDKVTLAKTADQAKQHWRDEQRAENGLFGGRDNDRGGANLNRSFSGTY